MLDDKLLVWKLRHGSTNALKCIYEKYRDDLLRLATALSNETSFAEDVVHDVFTSFIRSSTQFKLTGSLKGYLATCVVNRVRNANRSKRRHQAVELAEVGSISSDVKRPDQWIIHNEETMQLNRALSQLPYSQREAIVMYLQGGMRFREIARLQNVSIRTTQSRYRCGLQKLRVLLDGEVNK
ncbi:MAG: sigma-70 family RNA polymerase sigma factor [Phycisphaerales bacterium]|nr:MAG: sigma-70 family RNA polymerase sigma factor [Phycisphaerales bacterium]